MNINIFYKMMESRKKIFKFDPYEGSGRNTHFMLLYKDSHKFEIRSWKRDKKKNVIMISAVNWTVTAGPCTIELKLKNLKDWKFLEGKEE